MRNARRLAAVGAAVAVWLMWAFPQITAAQAKRGSLAGVVLGPEGRPVPRAHVIIQASDGRAPRATQTDAAGRFRFSVRAGLYEVRAEVPGHWSEWEHHVLVRRGQSTSVTLRLVLQQPPPAPVTLTGKIHEWTVPTENALPHDPAVDPAGNVWLTLQRANQLARFDPATQQWKVFDVPTLRSGPHGLTADADGNIWFTENSAGKIGRVDAKTGAITEYVAPTAEDPHTPIFGPDGALWFTAQRSNLVVRMDPRTGQMSEFRVPTPQARPYGIIPGPDGALWFCEFGTNKLGRIEPRTGTITEYAVPEADARPRRLAASGNAIYFTDFRGGRLGRFDLARKTFHLWPSPSGAASQPYGIAAEADGTLWYCEFGANQLVRFDPKNERFERFPYPSPRSEVRHMIRDARGRIWMALSGANKVAVVE